MVTGKNVRMIERKIYMKSEKQIKKQISKFDEKIQKYYDKYPELAELHNIFTNMCVTHDNESAHVHYDDILAMICKKHEPELFKLLNDIVDTTDVKFWYA